MERVEYLTFYGQVETAILTFVIAAYTFSLLFRLRGNITISYIVLILYFAIAQFPTSSGISVASAVAVLTSAVFVLSTECYFPQPAMSFLETESRNLVLKLCRPADEMMRDCLFGRIQLGRGASLVREWKQPVGSLLLLVFVWRRRSRSSTLRLIRAFHPLSFISTLASLT